MHEYVRSAVYVLTVAVTVALTGCNSTPRRDPGFAASYPDVVVDPMSAQTNSGAIFKRGYDIALFEDVKARRIGDVLTIRLSEANVANKSSDTTITRDHTSTVTNPTILGTTAQFDLPGALPLANTQDNTLASSLSAQHDFSGDAESALSNSLTGDISVTVADVLPNGNLVVRGEKRLNLNQGNEYIKISGIVRPIDITTDNSVVSTRVADATIIYNGDGATADANRMGWLSRFFVSAVFPF